MIHPCPRCGEATEGAVSQGGIRWAICETCMDEDQRWGNDQDAVRDRLRDLHFSILDEDFDEDATP